MASDRSEILRGNRHKRFRRASATVAFVAVTVPAFGQARYAVTDLGMLPEDTDSVPLAMNAGGEIVGLSSHVPVEIAVFHPVRWGASGDIERLATPAGAEGAIARGLNMVGDAVGVAFQKSTIGAVMWNSDGSITDLGQGQANRVNDARQVVGFTYQPGSQDVHATLWDSAGNAQDLGTLSGDPSSQATGINASGKVVGFSGTGTAGDRSGTRAFLWTPDRGMLELGGLPGGTSSQATAINDLEAVVGYSDSSVGVHAVLWNRDGGIRDLGTLGGASYAVSSNADGQVVGFFQDLDSRTFRPFIWNASDGMQDLNDAIPPDSGWVLERFTGNLLAERAEINNAGSVVVPGHSTSDRFTHALLLTPIAR